MTALALLTVAGLVFAGWLIGRRWLRIIVAVALVFWIGGAVIEGYQQAEAEAEARP